MSKMNKQVLTDLTESVELINKLTAEDNTVKVTKDNDSISIYWVKNKRYIDFTGQERTDEVWCTEDNRLIPCQDLSADHARNILRMLIHKKW